jgi:hypothetical protein
LIVRERWIYERSGVKYQQLIEGERIHEGVVRLDIKTELEMVAKGKVP